MKKVLALLLCAALSLAALTACGGGNAPVATADPGTASEAPAETPADEGAPAEEAAPAEAAPAVDTSKLTDFAWSVANDNVIGSLTFAGSNAELNLLVGGEDKSVSGPVTFSDKTMNIGGTDITWNVVASFCKLTVGEDQYSLSKADSAETAKGPYMLMTNSWSGDGMSLSFADGKATLSVDGGVHYVGSYTLANASELVVKDESSGNSDNLSIGAAASSSSNETADLPSENVCDGDAATRWASEYSDPQWVMLDLGSEKTVSASIVCWEVAYSSDFEFQYSSDGENWNTALAVTGQSVTGTGTDVAVEPVSYFFDSPVTAQYFRMYGTARATEYGHSMWEWELYEHIAGQAALGLSYSGDKITVSLNGASYTLSK